MAEKKLTISDIARRAGVSTGTVSAVINERSTVRDETRRRVLRVVEQVGYQPSPAARHLAGIPNDGNTVEPGIGVVIKEMENPYFSEVAGAVQKRMVDSKFLSFITASEGDSENERTLVSAMRNRFLSGIIIAPVLHDNVDLSQLFQLKRSEYPLVLVERVTGLQASVVSVDNVRAFQAAVQYLFDTGHERIVHFAGPIYSQHSIDRVLGLEKAFSQSHLRFSDDVIVPTGAHLRDGYDAALSYFREHRSDHPTGVACYNDMVALGVVRALTELGIHVPGDVSVVGFDDIPFAAYGSVPLTTVHVPKREIGTTAAELLLRAIETGGRAPVEQVVLQAELVVRESTRAVN